MVNTVGSQRISLYEMLKSNIKNFDFCILYFEFSEQNERLTP